MSLFYTDRGSGFPVILLHGFCETHVIWNEMQEALASKFRVIAIDLPGFGKSPLPPEKFSIADIARQILDFLQSIRINECITIGHSLGGYIALAMVEQEADRFRGLGLFHSTALADSAEKKESRNKVISFVEKNGTRAFTQTLIPALFFDKNNPFIDFTQELAAETPQETIIRYSEAMRDRPDTVPVIQSFKKPVLFITGERDPGISVESIEKQGRLAKNGKISVLSGVAHMGFYEAPEKTQRIVHQFLTSVLYEAT